MDFLTIKEWNKIKSLIREYTPYSIYKYFYNNFEKEKEGMLTNTFFYYLCYLNKKEFNILKNNIETKLNKVFNEEYQIIPLFNNNNSNKETENISLIKPKIEFENLSENQIISLIEKQNYKDIENDR